MIFEALTITLLSTLWSAWNANKPATLGTDDSKKKTELPDKELEQPADYPLDERLVERRNEFFLQVYAILISPEKSHFQQLTAIFKQLACIYGISSKLGIDGMPNMVLCDFKEYVKDLKKCEVAVDRLEKLKPLLEYAFRETDKGGVLKYYFLDSGKDKIYISNVMPTLYGHFDIILCDGFSESKHETKTNDLKNYNCLLGAAGDVYDIW